MPGPSGESFYGALVMSVPPAAQPADFSSMKKLTMPYPHAYCGVLRFSLFTLPSKICGREVRP
ncbi:hypothetical protein IE4803_CH03958 [Rhizobium etli bv. phaseoli str. IE4803]|nr:hypothetical protein IE4803_CH03958 [Rhizobium etli bv. phaseoli str. IE4803]